MKSAESCSTPPVKAAVFEDTRREWKLLSGSADGSVYVVESGDLGRPSGGIARVAADGAVARLRLVPA